MVFTRLLEDRGLLKCPMSYKYPGRILCSLVKDPFGNILYSGSSLGPEGLRDEAFVKEIEKLRWVPRDLDKARALIETVVRMEGYDGT